MNTYQLVKGPDGQFVYAIAWCPSCVSLRADGQPVALVFVHEYCEQCGGTRRVRIELDELKKKMLEVSRL